MSNSGKEHIMKRSVLILTLLTLVLAGVSRTVSSQTEGRVALKGLDPVLLVKGKELKGDEKLFVVKGGFRYFFSTADNKAAFEKEPKVYQIQLDGTSPVVPGAEGDPELFLVHKERIYIFATPGCVESFKANPGTFVSN
jgi:YHS domain-containing protein